VEDVETEEDRVLVLELFFKDWSLLSMVNA
jgi:hypothetical protein